MEKGNINLENNITKIKQILILKGYLLICHCETFERKMYLCLKILW